MTLVNRLKYGVCLVAAVAVPVLTNGCSAANDIAGAASGCDEFKGGSQSIAALSIDGDAKAFVTASSNLVSIVGSIETDVFNSCKSICTDLQVPDTWTPLAKGATSGADFDAAVNEACNQATTVLKAKINAQAACNLIFTPARCEVDVSAQASCQASCTGTVNCTPPDVTVACQPGELTGQCSATCNASATCEGSVDVQAQCTGSCGGGCTGTCDGNSCSGTKCAGKCEGKCTGDCKLAADANVNCGASVNCKGGCSVAYTAPKCETSVTPPSCNASASCQASCKSNVEATATCTKPSVDLQCGASVTADVIATVKTNLPALLSALQAKGELALDAAKAVADTGGALVGNLGSVGGKGLACATTAVSASATATASVNVSVSASANVSGACGGPGKSS